MTENDYDVDKIGEFWVTEGWSIDRCLEEGWLYNAVHEIDSPLVAKLYNGQIIKVRKK